MQSKTVLVGSQIGDKTPDGSFRVRSPHGDVFRVKQADVLQSDMAEPGGDLRRYTLADDAVVLLEMIGKNLSGIDAVDGTILKWVDDGGTISKSRDDG
jgi:hypothetical protein